MPNITSTIPTPRVPIMDPATGIVSQTWWYWFQSILARTGGVPGVDSKVVQTTAGTALTNAGVAQVTAQTAQTAAAAAQTTANSATAATAAETTARIAAVTAEATARTNADNLRALKASPVFTGAPPSFALFPTYASDAAAATGGIALGQFYWSGAAVVQRRV